MTAEQLRSYCDTYIKQNNRQAITGEILNTALNGVIDLFQALPDDNSIGSNNQVVSDNERYVTLNGDTDAQFVEYRNASGDLVAKHAGDGNTTLDRLQIIQNGLYAEAYFENISGHKSKIQMYNDYFEFMHGGSDTKSVKLDANGITQYGHHYLSGAGDKKVHLAGTSSSYTWGVWSQDGLSEYLSVDGTGLISGSIMRLQGANYPTLQFKSNVGGSINQITCFSGNLDIKPSTALVLWGGGVQVMKTESTGITIYDGKNFVFNTSTGSELATAPEQKIAFWGATPITRPVEADLASTPNSGDATTDAIISALINVVLNTGLAATS